MTRLAGLACDFWRWGGGQFPGLNSPISTAPAVDPARMDRRALGPLTAGCESSLAAADMVAVVVFRGGVRLSEGDQNWCLVAIATFGPSDGMPSPESRLRGAGGRWTGVPNDVILGLGRPQFDPVQHITTGPHNSDGRECDHHLELSKLPGLSRSKPRVQAMASPLVPSTDATSCWSRDQITP